MATGVETYDRTCEPLTQLVADLAAYFKTDEFHTLSRDQYIELASKTRSALSGLCILNRQYAQSGKSKIIDRSIEQISECAALTEEAIALRDAEESLDRAVSVFDTMVDRRGADQLCELQEQVRALFEENSTLKDQNKRLLEEVRLLRSENQRLHREMSSEGGRTFAALSAALTEFPSAAADAIATDASRIQQESP
jgi:cell division protein FtsB